ncbi:glycosyltransferase family 4 protein [Photobacterium sp. GB-1]|uniref:glycosyltransferase family 4 protein n=1 Tax=Photobacterium sp. GB-1 TaxID=2022111 RepID=UPI000D1654BD|nr:glycosyltransferase family 4 protein [Photobacterium sp. GB-1]PSV50209.1 hypothetical protein C9J45_21170 [Photobacterium sp. GB-1]
MKLVFFTESLKSGGAERVLSVIANHMVKKKFDVKIIVCDKEHDSFFYIDDEVEIKFLGFNYEKKNAIQFIKEQVRRYVVIRKELKEIGKDDRIISFLSHTNFRVNMASLFTGRKVYCCEHNNYFADKSRIFNFFKVLSYYFIAEKLSVLTSRDLNNYLYKFQRKIVVLPNPLGVNIGKPKLKNNDVISFLAIGRLTEQKGFERLLNIVYLYKNKYVDQSFRLIIAGDGILREKLENLSLSLKLNEEISFVGNINDVEDLYINSDIYLMTSLWEGLPMVLGEAMANGMPIISYDCPTGPREFIANNKSGFLIEDDNETLFVEAMYKLSNDDDLYSYMSKNAISKIKKNSINNIYEKWISFLDIKK